MHHADHASRDPFAVRLEELLRHVLAIGAVLVLLLPPARGFSETLGWLPLWLLAMPATALWALRGFPVPGPKGTASITRQVRRRSGPQARRRRLRCAAQGSLSRAA